MPISENAPRLIRGNFLKDNAARPRPNTSPALQEAPELLSPIEQWRIAEARIESYPEGFVAGKDDNEAYSYLGGRRLIVTLPTGEEHQVMDTCEAPWAIATVDAAFNADAIKKLDAKHKIKVFERGAGLGIVGRKVIDHLTQRGSGEYHVVELNEHVLKIAQEWRDEEMARIAAKSAASGIPYDIQIIIHDGDAREVAQKFAERGEKFNIIISDTFPISDDETGINDIADADVLASLLYKPEGIFTFFAYHPGMETTSGRSHLTVQQLNLLEPRFSKVDLDQADVTPASGYTYLFTESGPVRQLPVVICQKPK